MGISGNFGDCGCKYYLKLLNFVKNWPIGEEKENRVISEVVIREASELKNVTKSGNKLRLKLCQAQV